MNADTGVSRSPVMSKGGCTARVTPLPQNDKTRRPKQKTHRRSLPEMGFWCRQESLSRAQPSRSPLRHEVRHHHRVRLTDRDIRNQYYRRARGRQAKAADADATSRAARIDAIECAPPRGTPSAPDAEGASVRFKELLDSWRDSAADSPTAKSYAVRLPLDEAAQLLALAEMFPGRTVEQLISELLAAALKETAAAMPYVAGRRVIATDEQGDPIYE